MAKLNKRSPRPAQVSSSQKTRSPPPARAVPSPEPPPLTTVNLEEIQAKLDRILAILAQLRLRKIKLPFEDPKDRSIRLLDPDEVAYLLTAREDQNRRKASGQAPGPEEPPSDSDDHAIVPRPSGGDDSLLVYTVTGQIYRSYATLGDFRARLQGYPGFLTTHRSYLVNLDHAVRVEITPSGRRIYVAGVDLPAEVSRDNVRAVEQYLEL